MKTPIINKIEYNEENFWQGVLIFKRGLFAALGGIFLGLAILAVVLIVIILSSIGLSAEELSVVVNKTSFPLILLLCVLGYALFKFFTYKKSLRKKFMENRSRTFDEKILTFAEDGYTCESESENRFTKYTDIAHFQETSQYFYFIMKDGSMDLVDKNGFISGDREKFVTLVTESFVNAKKRFLRK